MISDWLHRSAFDEYDNEKGPRTVPMADSIVVSGKGHDPLSKNGIGGSYTNVKFSPGKRYLLRIINSSAGTSFHFSIDNHFMTVIAADFVPIKPYPAASIFIGIGEPHVELDEY